MRAHTEYLWFTTRSRRELINITDRIADVVATAEIAEGLCLVSAMHITSGIWVNDEESGLKEDLIEWLDRLAPRADYRHHRTGEDNGDAHLKRTLVHHQVVLPVTAGKLDLGESGKGAVKGAGEDGRIETPYLQLVMQRLWTAERETGSRTLRLETLRELGGAEQIVRDRLRGALEALSPEQQDVTAALFNHLVTPSGTKIAHGPADLAEYAHVDEATLVLDPGWLEGVTLNTVEPAPVGEASRDGRIAFELGHIPAGDQYRFYLHFQVNPTEFGRVSHDVELYDGDTLLARVDRTTTIWP